MSTEEQKQYHKEYYQTHKDVFKTYALNRDKERVKEYHKKYYLETKNRRRLFTKKAKAISKYPGELTIQTIQLVYEDNIKKFGTLTCYLCLKPITFNADALEHKIPATRGGTNQYDNLAIAHISCNNKKRLKTETEYKEVILCRLT